MPPRRRTPYLSVNLTEPARNALQRASLNMSATVGKRLSMSAIAVAVVAVAERHADELQAELTRTEQEEK